MEGPRQAPSASTSGDVDTKPSAPRPSGRRRAPPPPPPPRRRRAGTRTLLRKLAEVNNELWLILSMIVIAALLNHLATGHRIVLGFYTFPTLFSAYHYGRRHATLTAIASIAVVILLGHVDPRLWEGPIKAVAMTPWTETIAWGAMLMITGYTMGTLHERNEARLGELRSTYRGMLMILRQFIGRDKRTENHCYRVSFYAARIAERMRLPPDRIEDVQAAALLHDIGKLDVSREVLERAASLSHGEHDHVKSDVAGAEALLEPVSGPLGRILPIILSHDERFDGSGYEGTRGEEIPLESRIIAVADAYDAMTSDRPYRSAMSHDQAREIIETSSGADFDPEVVSAFLVAFQRKELKLPLVVV